ncbi:hypothetical protein, partial [Escherichia coli]|uniref:hypothetical protein n=1 Tax=Escherichia coli TaxID=562 RepID=UPI001BE47742
LAYLFCMMEKTLRGIFVSSIRRIQDAAHLLSVFPFYALRSGFHMLFCQNGSNITVVPIGPTTGALRNLRNIGA